MEYKTKPLTHLYKKIARLFTKKRVDYSRKEELDRLLKIAGQLPGVIYQYRLFPDGSSCFPFASDAMRDIYRVSPDEVRQSARKIFKVIHPDDYQEVINSIYTSAQNLSSWQHEYRVKFPDGVIRTLYGNALPQREEDGSTLWHGFITDITEQRQTEAALREIEQQRTNILNDVQDVVWSLNWPDLKVNYISPSVEVVFGRQVSDFVSNPLLWSEVVHPDDKHISENAFKQLHKKGSAVRECRIIRPDGTIVWINDKSKIIVDNQGNPIRIDGVSRDITDRKTIEIKLKESEHFYRSVLDTIGSEIAILNEHGTIVAVNLAWPKFGDNSFSKSEIQFEGVNYLTVCDSVTGPDGIYARSAAEGIRAILQRKKSSFTLEYPCDTPDGPGWYTARFTSFETEGVLHIVVANEDMTAIKLAETNALDQAHRYQALLEAANDGIHVVGTDGSVLEVNKACCTMLGYTREELLTMNISDWDVKWTRPELLSKLNEMIGCPGIFETRHRRKDGTILDVEINTSTLSLDGRIYLFAAVRDISDRKLAEAALLKSKEDFKAIANYAASWEAWFNPDGKLIWMNPYSVKLTGYTPEEYMEAADFLAMFSYPDDLDRITQNFKGAMQGGTGANVEVRALHKDGSYLWLSISWGPILNTTGASIGFRTSAQNITERKRLEEEKLITDSKILTLSLAIGQSPVSTVITDAAGNIEYVNPRFTQTTGYTAEEVIGRNPRMLKTDSKSAAEYKQMWDTLLSGQTWNGVFQNKKKNGELYWESAVISPVTDNSRTITHFLAVKEDITERKRMEEELRESEKRYRLLIETAREGIFVAQEGKFKFVNPVMAEFTGYKNDEILEMPFLEFVHPDDRELIKTNYLKRMQGEPVESSYQIRVLKKGGSTRWIAINAVKIDWKGQPATLNLISDITENKMTELEIKLKNEELQKLNSERERFFSIIAHDLRGPLGGFMGLTEVLADQTLHFTPDEIKEMTLELSHSARNTFNLLENLLEWSQMDRGKTAFNPERFDLNMVINECVNLAIEQARGKDIRLSTANNTQQDVFADKNMIRTIIRNLLSNAIKFTPEGGTVIISSDSTPNRMARISVKDSGIGMPEQMRTNLFRVDSSSKRPGTKGEKSTGLGLLLCKEFIKKNNGEIWVESEPNNGSLFCFTIPSADLMDGQDKSEKEQDNDHKPVQPKKPGILIAEDDEISAKLISVMVKGFTPVILRAKSVTEAVEICRNNPDIDLVLMDIAMPGMDGLEAVRQIRKFNKDLIIIAQTTFALRLDKENALRAGCNAYLEKPLSKERLTELINQLMLSREIEG